LSDITSTLDTYGTPFRAAMLMTREIVAAVKALRVEVHDNVVIVRGNHASFKVLGLSW